MIRIWSMLFLLMIGMSLFAQDQNDLTYDVEMLLPEQFSQYTYITGIQEDKKGYIWLSSYKGLSCFDGQKIILYNNKHTTDQLFLSDEGTGYKHLFTTDNGLHLWTIEYETGKVICFNTDKRKIVESYEKERDVISTYLFSAHGHIYAVKNLQDSFKIISYTNDKFKSVTTEPDVLNRVLDISSQEQILITENYIFSVSPKGHFQKEERTKSLFQMQLDSFSRHAHGINSSVYYQRFEDDLWLTNYLRTIKRWSNKKQKLEDYTDVLNNLTKSLATSALKGELIAIHRSKNGDTFLCFANSIFRLYPKGPKEEVFIETIDCNKPILSMRQITEDDDGNIYASFYTGVAVKRKGGERFDVFRNTLNLPKKKEATYSLSYYKDQLIWNTSTFSLKNKKTNFIYFNHHGKHINHLLEKDTLWMFSWQDNKWMKHDFTTKKTKVINVIEEKTPIACSGLIQDKNGFFWITTDNIGILKINRNGEIEKKYSIKELGLDLEHDYLYGLYLENDKLYFCSQVGFGEIDLKTDKVRLFNIPYSDKVGELVPRIVYSILPDNNGNYYLGTNYGIVYFVPKLHKFKTLIIEHPLANKEFNRNSAYQSRDGRFYFGTINGLYSFLPDELIYEKEVNDISAPTIYNLQVYNGKTKKVTNHIHDWDSQKTIQLNPSDQNIIVEYSSPYHDNIFYKYRILGLQDDWSSLTSEGRMEIYTLPPGKFIIELKAQKGSLTNTELLSHFDLIKPQFWYKRWWAIVSYFLACVAAISFFFRWRYQRQLAYERKMNKLRTSISSDLHDDVGSLLGGLAIQSELLAKKVPEEHKAKLKEFSNTSREAMDLMRDTVWAIDSRKDKYENLLDRMYHFAQNMLGRKNIEYSFDITDKLGSMTIDPRLRRNVYLIFKEALVNIVKHSDCDKAHITLVKAGNQHILKIKDNGNASETLSSDGQGLSNMKMRAKQIGGKLTISQINGFEVVLRF